MIKYKALILRHLRAGGAHNPLILNDLCWRDPIVQINKNTKKRRRLAPPSFFVFL